jgi:hypothetical protein
MAIPFWTGSSPPAALHRAAEPRGGHAPYEDHKSLKIAGVAARSRRTRVRPRGLTRATHASRPNQLGNRLVVERVTVGAVELQPGAYLTLCIGAANRDPREFSDPERFDITRKPNRHLAFAAGAHACAGMSVARLEAQVALLGMTRRFPELQLAGLPVRGGRARFRGFRSLPARLG